MSQSNCVIYKFTSPSGKSYIGQTNNLKVRIRAHKRKSSKCTAISFAIQKHGFENFTQEILKENLTLEEANHWEEKLIAEHDTLSPNGYNLVTGGNNKKHSADTIARMSAAKKNMSAETRAKMSEISKKRVFSEETRAKMSAARKGKKLSPETIAKLSEINSNRSSETRAKLSAALKGRKIAPEIVQKTAETLRLVMATQEVKERMAAAQRGKKLSLETIAKREETKRRKKLEKINL
jgi:group I intron endonuclease